MVTKLYVKMTFELMTQKKIIKLSPMWGMEYMRTNSELRSNQLGVGQCNVEDLGGGRNNAG